VKQIIEWRTSERSTGQGGECVEVSVFEVTTSA
jgi:Domain of unknown function (DUF397)